MAELYALSVKQPWATLLVHGLKAIEVRSWRTARRGRVLIHAAGIPDERPEGWAHLPAQLREAAGQRRGIVGAADLIGVRRYDTLQQFNADAPLHLNEAAWFRQGLHGFRFANAGVLPFHPCPGQTRFFRAALPSAAAPPARKLSVHSKVEPRLLVSVRNALEAEAALAGGAAMLDVKEPARGSLGRADDAAIAAVVQAARGRVPVSAALGEWSAPGAQDWPAALEGLSYLKWGLAGCARSSTWETLLRTRAEQLRVRNPAGRVVAVAYADWQRARAPAADDVCAFATAGGAGALLVDTWVKDGSTLLDWANLGELDRWCIRCRQASIPIALAGSLGEEQIRALRSLSPDWFAVRRAVCAGEHRTGNIDPERVRRLSELVAETVTLPQHGS